MGSLFDGVIGWSINNRVVVLVVALAISIGGVWSTSKATYEVLPDFTPPFVIVQTDASGLSTSDVEDLVTGPLERALLGTPQAQSVRSTSSSGLSVITLFFEDDVDVYRARQLVTERIDLAGPLPTGVHRPELVPVQAPIGALISLCLTSTAPDPIDSARALRTFAETSMRPRLLAIPGIAQVTAHGGSVVRLEVQPDPLRMSARGVAFDDVVTAVHRSQGSRPGGTVDVGAAHMDVQTQLRLTVDDATSLLADVVVICAAPSCGGGTAPVRVGDVADVVVADEPALGLALYDGQPAVYVMISKLPGGDTLYTTRLVEAALHDLEADLPAGARFELPVFRQASFIATSLESVGRAMGLGAVFVVVVLLAFLRSGRLAIISLTAIPLSLLIAVFVLVALGVSINGMTLGGLAIAVGEVVDDAIVDVENVWRRLRENARAQTPRAALDVVRDASREVRSSVVYATVIVAVVLLPVLLLGGIAGRIFSPLAQAYVLAIVASLFVALTVTPALCAWLLPHLATRDVSEPRLAALLVQRYRRAVRVVVDRPRIVFATAAVVALAAFVALPFISGGFLPEFQEGSFIAHAITAPGTSLHEATDVARRLDLLVRPAAATHIAARIGRSHLDEDAAPVNRIEMDVVVPPDDPRDSEELVIAIAERIGAMPGVVFLIENFLGERIHEILAGDTSPVVVTVSGPETGPLRALAARVSTLMQQVPGLGAVRMESQADVLQVRVRPDLAAIGAVGLRPLDIAEQVEAWRGGALATQVLQADGRIIEVVVVASSGLRDPAVLRDLPIKAASGRLVPLSSLASIDVVAVPEAMHHEAGQRRITIGANARGAGLSSATAELERRLRVEVPVPRGYRVVVGGEGQARSDAAVRLLLIGALVLLGIFVLLASAFRSVVDAAIVMLNFPLGLIGGVIAAVSIPDGLSVAGFVGFVTLFGIIARNGILLVAHKRDLDRRHPEQDPVDRVLRAAEERLLPIVMTAATAGLGLLPLALSITARGSELESPMALIVCGGLLTSTALNMLLLPTVYVWLARRKQTREIERAT